MSPFLSQCVYFERCTLESHSVPSQYVFKRRHVINSDPRSHLGGLTQSVPVALAFLESHLQVHDGPLGHVTSTCTQWCSPTRLSSTHHLDACLGVRPCYTRISRQPCHVLGHMAQSRSRASARRHKRATSLCKAKAARAATWLPLADPCNGPPWSRARDCVFKTWVWPPLRLSCAPPPTHNTGLTALDVRRDLCAAACNRYVGLHAYQLDYESGVGL
jgi:hypothetical protein